MFKTLDYLLKRNSLSVSVHIRNEVNKYIYIYKKEIKSNNQINSNYYRFCVLSNLSPAIKYLIFRLASRVLINKSIGL